MHIEIRNETGERHAKWGTKVFIDGIEMPELADVQLHHRAGRAPTVNAELNANGAFKVELDAEVYVSIIAFPGYDLLCVPSSGPGQPARYYTVPSNVELETRL